MVAPKRLTEVPPFPIGTRRLARVACTHPLLFELMTKGWHSAGGIRTIEGLPPEAVFIASWDEAKTQTTHFLFYHPSFEEVPIGKEIPMVPVEFRTEPR